MILKGLTAQYLIRAAGVPQTRNNCALQTRCPAAIVSGGLYQWISGAYQSSVATLEDLGGILIEARVIDACAVALRFAAATIERSRFCA